MKITTHKDAVNYLESFIGKIKFEITPEFLKHHDPLERMRVLLSLLGNPQNKFQSVLVGGTSGKGSTAYLISHILTTAGYKTGLTISPHLQKVNERLQINGQPVSDEQFLGMFSSIVDTIELMKAMSVGAPSYFEIIIAMAFLYFAQQKVDIAVVEVGMGGEFDATNTLYPLIAVLTNVSLDHTNILGGTVQKIAKTKAGIIKKHSSLRSLRQFGDSSSPNVSQGSTLARAEFSKIDSKDALFKSSPHAKAPYELKRDLVVVTGVKQPSVIKIVDDRCKEVDAELFRLHKDFDFRIKKESLEGSVFDLTINSGRVLKLNDLKISLLGRYQVENASLAIETVLNLKDFGFKVSKEHIRTALKTAFFPGRFEIIPVINFQSSVVRRQSVGSRFVSLETDEAKTDEPKSENRKQTTDNRVIILDGAHNPTKMRAFLSTLKKLYPKNPKVFVIGFKNDKNTKGMLKEIVRVADTIIVTEFHSKTDMSRNASAEASKLKAQSSKLKANEAIKIFFANNSKLAMGKAFEIVKTQKDSIIVVTGSLYLVGEVREHLQGQHSQGLTLRLGMW